MKKILFSFCALAMLLALAGCSNSKSTTIEQEDMVVYGTIYTGDSLAPLARAIVIQSGKFIYVGDEEGAKPYEKIITKVIDHRGKGMVTPGFVDGHAHYLMSNGMKVMGALMFDMDTKPNELLKQVSDAYIDAKKIGKPAIYGFGWTYQYFEKEMPTLAQLDSVCPDLPLYLADSEGHKGLANSVCMRNAGIIKDDGTLYIDSIRGGEIVIDKVTKKPSGLLKEQAGTYCRLHGIDFSKLMSADQSARAVSLTRDALHSNGYVAYMDGWSNYYGNLCFYDAAQRINSIDSLNLCLGLAYEIESSEKELEKELNKAFSLEKYATSHINPRYVKTFMDGTVETKTGLVCKAYNDGTFGKPNWTPKEFSAITDSVNKHGFTMHTHAMGDSAVHLVVDAFVKSPRKERGNTLVHVRNVKPDDYTRIAYNGIVVTEGILWHTASDTVKTVLQKILPVEYVNKSYPMKSFFDNKVIMSSHSDFPALSGSSENPFYIMEIAVTGLLPKGTSPAKPFWTEELIDRQQALEALTINGAYQMHNEEERGNIMVGKYADFVLVDKDVISTSCPANEIHTAKVISTYFEGKQVYPKVK